MTDDNTKLIIVLEAQSVKLQRSLVQVNRQIDRFAAQTEKRFEQMQRRNAASFDKLNSSMRGSLSGLRNLIGPVVGTLGVREVIRFSDAWTEAGNKIAAASQVSGLQARSLEELKDGANGARQELTQYVDLYARLLRVSPNVAATEIEVARATDIVAKSLKAGGASAQEQAAALIQLGQAVGSGFLQGDELRSLRENAPLLAKAIAEEFGVTIGELKELGAEGKITSDRVFKAILKGGADIEAAFDATQSTIQDAFTRINNEFTEYIGTAGASTGATQGLIDALRYLADNFSEIAPVVANFAAVLAAAFAGKMLVVGIGEAVIALGTLLTALSAGTLGAATFSAALGPIGLLAGATAGALYLLWQYQEDAARAAKAHADMLSTNAEKLGLAKDASNQFRGALRQQIQLQMSAASAALAEAKAQLVANAARMQLAQQLSSVPFLGNLAAGAQTGFSAMLAADLAKIADAQKTLDALRIQLADADNSLTLPEGDGDRAKSRPGGGVDSKDKDNAFDKAMKSILERTAALQAETAAQAALNPLINDYGFALEKARATHDLLTAAQQAGLAITPELKASIEALATGYATASVEAKKLAEAQDKVRESAQFMRDTLKDATSSFIQDLLDGKSAAEALSNALVDVGNRLIGLGLDTLFGTGNDFGAVGKLFGFANGGVAANGRPKMFANGGVSRTAAIFGEGPLPEAAVPLPDGRRIPVDLRMPERGTGGNSLAVPIHISIDAKGADAAGLARVERQLAGLKAELPARIKHVVSRRGKDWI